MKAEIVSEVRKLRTTRAMWWLLGVLVAAVSAVAFLAARTADASDLTGVVAEQPFAQIAMTLVPAFAVVLAIRSYTDEVRHGSIVPTLLASPSRSRVLVAKAVVAAVAGASLAIAAQAVAMTLGAALVAAEGFPPVIAWASVASTVAAGAVAGVLWSLLGVGVGVAVRHQVPALVGSLVWILVAEYVLASFAPGLATYLPVTAGGSLLGLDGAPLSPTAGGLVLAGWAAAALAAGRALLRRRDVI
jgi:ABC-type transport system involved in multi-copper enzyme maturation permease subunit